MSALPLDLSSGGARLDSGEGELGLLVRSDDIQRNAAALSARMSEDGYLYIPSLLNPDDVMLARREITETLAGASALRPGTPPLESRARDDIAYAPIPAISELSWRSATLSRLLHSGSLRRFFEHLLQGATRHFDYKWIRVVPPGRCAQPHCDIVYMGRGTKNLYSVWVPLGDVPFELGGLMILEGSHRHERLRDGYGRIDVDEIADERTERKGRGFTGWLARDPNKVRRAIGRGRPWRVGEFRAGDAVIFTAHTVHATLDNRSDRLRLAADTRYQLAVDPIDPRWVAEHDARGDQRA